MSDIWCLTVYPHKSGEILFSGHFKLHIYFLPFIPLIEQVSPHGSFYYYYHHPGYV
jgi:hypothetical protein